MVMSPQSTYLYASGVDNKIDLYPLDTTKKGIFIAINLICLF